ncbi:hypothetical protein HNP73_002828 [Amaricoccus macauensis]|uniref:BLUF domain-containing protein n=1 Tax=Amaricoccus macauensis TaxID=57001 RepID=A0A840SUR2_9RHOB|nr:BLUF domain-containing protein [Amaricoccus macauensis]MBB5222881.1 hypothetical protein [Amaricoccus macauensis]
MVVWRPEASLIQLVFTCGGGQNLTPDALQVLVDDLGRANARAKLTGLLLRQGDSFYGVLEGSERRMLARVESMISDPRLGGVRVLKEEAIAQRRFGNWSFGALPAVHQASNAAEDFIIRLAQRKR